MMDLSVIIVNYNVRQFLENSLASIMKAMDGIEGEIIVVDNASEDGSVEMVRRSFPGVCLVENRENIGFARANNMALQKARGEFILLINPDTLVQEDTLRVMLAFCRENPEVGLAGCKILNPDGTFQLACRRSFPTPWVAFTKISGLSALFPRSRVFGKYNLTFLSPDESYEVEAVSGSFMMVARRVYEQIGGLDESFFMYGEDLDWCYRVSKAGYKVYYVHSTKIIHYKGESTRRSELDELKLFYDAMHLFVGKHFSRSTLVALVLRLGIWLRSMVAFFGRTGGPLMMALVDAVLVDLSLILSERIYFGSLFRFPDYAYPIVWTVPAALVVATMYFYGLYSTNRFSASRASIAVVISYVIISATIFFAKEFAFSRAVVVISGVLVFIVVPGWRIAVRMMFRSARSQRGRKSLFGRRTVIVGTGESAREVLRRLRARVDDGYEVLGFIALQRKEVGEKHAGVEVIGSIDTIGKVVSERRVGEVIFSTDGLSYTDILSVISRSNSREVNFRLVPNSLEAIIGKTRIDQLDNLPFVEIEYNIHRTGNRVLKRIFDIIGAAAGLVLLYLPVLFLRQIGRDRSSGQFARNILLLPQVLIGRLSLVGCPFEDRSTKERPVGSDGGASPYLGPQGLTGLVQINKRDDLEEQEIERYKLYYAKNQSLILDIEILAKSFLQMLTKS